MNLPDFVCIGAQKAGTSWLHAVLREHPNVWLSPIKELHFFDRVGDNSDFGQRNEVVVGKRIRWAQGGRQKGLLRAYYTALKRLVLRKKSRRDRPTGKTDKEAYVAYLDALAAFKAPTEAWYSHVFSWPVPSGTLKGEITPRYLELGEEKVRYARSLLGEKKILLIVRSPVERELSQIRMYYQSAEKTGTQPQTPEAWMGFYDAMIKRFARGCYSEGIPRWQRHFGVDNVKIMPFGDIRDNPKSLIAEIETFLGIDHFNGYHFLESKVHTTKTVDIPDDVVARVRDKVAPEEAYIRATFGDEFFRRSR
jgi:hypothetical protein